MCTRWNISPPENPNRRKHACCVPGCNDRFEMRHRFPSLTNYPDLFKLWLERIKPLGYEALTYEEAYRKFMVCRRHFSPHDLVPGRRGLKVTAVPCLNIPGFQSEEVTEDSDTSQDNLTEIPEKRRRLNKDIPSTSQQCPSSMALSTAECSGNIIIETSISQESVEEPDQLLEETLTNIVKVPEKPSKGKTPKKFTWLGKVNVTRSSNLTPKARRFYGILKTWASKKQQQQRKISSLEDRLINAEKTVKSQNYKKFLKCVNDPTYAFILGQIKNQVRKPKARRFTIEQKILALSIYKSSAKGYRLLQKIFALPSSKTLAALLHKIPLDTGINKHLFESIRIRVAAMKDDRQKVCALLWDEMEIDEALHYDKKIDKIIGFEDSGHERKSEVASYANVFMIRGLYHQWRQPIAFSFSSGPVKSIILKNIIKETISECSKIGLDIVSSICDQGSANQAAVNLLLNDTKVHCLRQGRQNTFMGYLVEGKEIIHLYDVPHLFKGIRNNLMNKDLHFQLNGRKHIAKWCHIKQLYELDESEPDIRICHKLTDAHIYASKMNKMKVKQCTQVFSHTVGSLMKRISRWDIKDNLKLAKEAEDTAELILFLDQLFDSLNISRYTKVQRAKPLKCPLTSYSEHFDFWFEAKKVLCSMQFFSTKKNAYVYNPSIKNLIFTLKGFETLSKKLLEEKKFRFILTGALNHDPLEKIFSYIRAHGLRNTNPDTVHFISSFKTLLINNYLSAHSPGSNCQKDSCVEGLDNLRSFLTGEVVSGVMPLEDVPLITVTNLPFRKTKLARNTIQYMAGAIVKFTLKDRKTGQCENCKSNLLKRNQMNKEDDEFINVKTYKRGKLSKPGDLVSVLVSNSLSFSFRIIPDLCTESQILRKLQENLKKHFHFNTLNCEQQHPLGLKFCKVIARCCLFWWSKSVNKILKGRDLKFKTYSNIQHQMNKWVDPIKEKALKKYEKRFKNNKNNRGRVL